MTDLTSYTRWIGRSVAVVIDRPAGSAHPRHPQMVYRLNYGFVPGTMAGDGAEIDAYVLGVGDPLTRFDGVCIAVIARRDDVEHKLVAAPVGATFTDAEIRAATAFQERYFDSRVVR